MSTGVDEWGLCSSGACARFKVDTRTLLCALALPFPLGCMQNGTFKDQPIVWRVDDQKNIAEPEAAEFHYVASALDWYALRRLTRTLELRDEEAAHNVNALDEVPDSSWFTNRIGVREMSPEEVAEGASAAGPPHPPLWVVSGKPGGANPGFVAKDRDGRKFVVKFDTKENPELQTATNTIVNRIFWAAGYNVPNDTVFQIRPEAIHIDERASATDELGRKGPFTREHLENILGGAPRGFDGSYRATASEFIEGIPKGGLPPEGTRDDDPNDTIPHEHRRELRGLRVFAAWVNHTDMKEDNTLSSYVEERGRHYLKHYLVDFGEALGAHAAEKSRYEDGYEHWFDWQAQPKAAVAFGLWVREWEHLKETPWPSVGAFSAEHFDPDAWHEAYPYWPFFETDARDAYWAAKIILRFTRAQLAALVREARLSHPRAAAYLVDALYRRRSIIGSTYFERLSPLDHFGIDSERLCAVDLSVYHGIVTSGLVEALDEHGEVQYDTLVGPRGRVCLPIFADDRYRIYRLRTRRRAEVSPVMQVHFKGGTDPRILGIVRLEQ